MYMYGVRKHKKNEYQSIKQNFKVKPHLPFLKKKICSLENNFFTIEYIMHEDLFSIPSGCVDFFV